MKIYIINRNADNKGNNEIHDLNNCGHLPNPENQVQLGSFENARKAKNFAKKNGWPCADGCAFCSSEAHTK